MARARTEFIPDQLHNLANALLESAREAADSGDVEAACELLVKSFALDDLANLWENDWRAPNGVAQLTDGGFEERPQG
jgi:hypothetical protein